MPAVSVILRWRWESGFPELDHLRCVRLKPAEEAMIGTKSVSRGESITAGGGVCGASAGVKRCAGVECCTYGRWTGPLRDGARSRSVSSRVPPTGSGIREIAVTQAAVAQAIATSAQHGLPGR